MVIFHDECFQVLIKLLNLDGIEIDKASPCNYDQGSPLVQGNYAIGIMSKNRGCSGNFAPTIYTRLSTFHPWIGNTAGKQPTPTTLRTHRYT